MNEELAATIPTGGGMPLQTLPCIDYLCLKELQHDHMAVPASNSAGNEPRKQENRISNSRYTSTMQHSLLA
jgi:hypothetical protein